MRRRSKYLPPMRPAIRRLSSDLAVPGGPKRRRCSPQRAARMRRRTSVSRSKRPDWRSVMEARTLRPRRLSGLWKDEAEASDAFFWRVASCNLSTWADMSEMSLMVVESTVSVA